MRLTRAIVAHNQQTLVVGGLVELEVFEGKVFEPGRHIIRYDIGFHQPAGVGIPVRVAQLHHRLDSFKLDQFAVFHYACPPA